MITLVKQAATRVEFVKCASFNIVFISMFKVEIRVNNQANLSIVIIKT